MAAVILDDRLPSLISWILFTYIARADRQDIINSTIKQIVWTVGRRARLERGGPSVDTLSQIPP